MIFIRRLKVRDYIQCFPFTITNAPKVNITSPFMFCNQQIMVLVSSHFPESPLTFFKKNQVSDNPLSFDHVLHVLTFFTLVPLYFSFISNKFLLHLYRIRCKSIDRFLYETQHWAEMFPVGIYMFKVNDRNTKTRREIC